MYLYNLTFLQKSEQDEFFLYLPYAEREVLWVTAVKPFSNTLK